MTRTNGARVALLKLVTKRIYHKCTCQQNTSKCDETYIEQSLNSYQNIVICTTRSLRQLTLIFLGNQFVLVKLNEHEITIIIFPNIGSQYHFQRLTTNYKCSLPDLDT